MYKKLLVSLLSVALVVSLFCGCAKTEVAKTDAQVETKVEVQTKAQKETKSEEPTVIMRTGELFNMMPFSGAENDPEYPTYYYEDLNSMILALQSKKIDSIYGIPEITARYIENHIDDVKAIEPETWTGSIGLCIGTLKENTEIYNLLNDAIEKLSNNGTIKNLQDEYLDKYLRTKEEPKPVNILKIDGAKTIKVAITGDMPPLDLVLTDGKPTGFNVALLSEISKLTNTNIELVQMNSGSRLTALKSNTIDAVFYNKKYKFDDAEIENFYASCDLPDEIVITKPYYTSRVYKVAYVDVIKKAEAYINQEKAQNDNVINTGEFPYASLTEEEENDKIRKNGWKINTKYFDNLSQMMLAMKSGQIDYISLLPKSTAKYIEARNNDTVLYKSAATNDDRVKYSMATLEENKEVYNILNDTLNDIIKDGTIKNIETKYIDGFIEDKEDPKVVDMPHFDGARTIKVAVTGDLPPFDFVSADGSPAGYNAALLSEIANRTKVNIELVPMDEKAKVTALVTKNIDAIFWLSSLKYADERNTFYDCPKGVILTDCYYEDKLYLICPKGGKVDKMFNTN